MFLLHKFGITYLIESGWRKVDLEASSAGLTGLGSRLVIIHKEMQFINLNLLNNLLHFLIKNTSENREKADARSLCFKSLKNGDQKV